MSRKELPWILLLGAFLLAWPTIDRKILLPLFPPKAPAPAAPAVSAPPVVSAAVPVPAEAAPEEAISGHPNPMIAAPSAETEETPARPEEWPVLTNDCVKMTFTTYGAALRSVQLLKYRESVDRTSPPVILNFPDRPVLSYSGLPGLGASNDFTVQALENGRQLRFERHTASGLWFVRTVTLDEAYRLSIRDEFRKDRGENVSLPPHRLRLGILSGRPGETRVKGMEFLGLDTLSPGGEKVQYWGKQFAKFFSTDRGVRPPESVDRTFPIDGQRLDWVALKEKYFVLILTPEGGAESVSATIRRTVTGQEISDPGFKPSLTLASVEADVKYAGGWTSNPDDAVERVFTLYAGPKQYSELSRFAFHQVDLMEFGMWAPIGKVLLRGLNAFHRLIPNYGIAIILLTCIIRLVFWPLTHKSGQNMKRMQELQPEIAKIKASIKDPKKQQQATMALYKEHKVNPVSGCLPMLIQIPVFIALFVVLRSAIELRFAPFLWIKDLSEPENLFHGAIPYLAGLNLLPLIMTAVQVWQQKLTPAAGDPAQQKMMTWMPIIMLVFFYSFASGLVLYWTANQSLMIVQLLLQRRHAAHRPA